MCMREVDTVPPQTTAVEAAQRGAGPRLRYIRRGGGAESAHGASVGSSRLRRLGVPEVTLTPYRLVR
jgi:hypothetical protein